MKLIESPARKMFVYYLCFLCGVLVPSYFWLPRSLLYVTLIFVAVLIPVVIVATKKVRFLIGAFLVVLLGITRVFFSFPANTPNSISYWNESNVTMDAVVNDEIRMGAFAKLVRVEAKNVSIQEKNYVVSGNVRINVDQKSNLAYGDEIKVKCTLRSPPHNNDIPYDRILAKDGIFSECVGVPDVALMAHKKGNPLYHLLFSLKERVNEVMRSLFWEPHTSFLAGILYGDRASLPKNLVHDFQISGMSHILAISGYNITILVGMLSALFLTLRIRRKWAIIALLFSVAFFVIFVGGSGSVVRAALMGLIPHGARFISRRTNPLYVLAFVAVSMVVWNPLILLYDVGFELSVVATWGMIALSPIIIPMFKRIPVGLAEPLVTSLAAIIATTPLIAYLFGRVSVVGILANILVLPAIPSLMATAALALVWGTVSLSIAKIVAYVAVLISSYCLAIIHSAAAFPWASFEVPWFGLFSMLSCYVVLLWMRYGVDFHFKSKKRAIVSLDNETWYIDEHEKP